VTFLLALAFGHASADITTDGSVGPALSLPGPDFQVTASLGQQVGGNLFHSFTTFNINTGESATFSSLVPVSNVISRVTGGSASNIDGLLRSTIPGADVYLLNPNGVMIGDNASLNVSGSFYASTADYLKLGTNGRFDASNPGNSVLVTAAPSAFGFLGSAPASISVQDSLLQTPDGETLELVGGDINISDGNLYAPDGQVVLVSVASAGEVPVDPAAINLGSFTSLGRITVANPSGTFPFLGLGEVGNLDVTTTVPGDVAGGGRIIIRGGEFVLDEGLARAEVIEDTNGGGIDIAVSGTATLSGDAKVLTRTFFFNGDAGPITIKADTLIIGGDTTISSDSSGSGAGGTITVNTDTILATDRATISSDAQSSGNSGNILITTDTLDMADDSVVKTSSFGGNASGDAGNIVIIADGLLMAGDATINSSSELGSQGAGGTVTVDVDTIEMREAAWIISYTETTRDAGTIDIDSDTLSLTDQSVISTTTFADGNGGTITIDTGQLTLTGDAVITSGTEGPGNAGNVIITVDNGIDAGDSTTISSESEGGNFFVRGGADLSGATGGGDGGLVQLTANRIDLTGNAVIASGTAGDGAGGDVELNAVNISLDPASGISAVSTGAGNAGNITVLAGDSLEMDGSFIRTRAVSSDGGNIAINAPSLVYLLNSEITTSVESGFGNGGNITIDPQFVILNNSRIIANAFGGNGGNILIVANNFVSSADSLVDASSALGINGTVNIQSPDTDLSSGLTDMPESFLNVAALLREPCRARRSVNQSSFIVRGRSAIPPGPMSPLPVMDTGFDGIATSHGQAMPVTSDKTRTGTGVTLTGLSHTPLLMAQLIECGR
jgi:filamentous hemagglutinin family protein